MRDHPPGVRARLPDRLRSGSFLAAAVALVAVVTLGTSLDAQQRGVIRGTVVSASTAQALEGAQVLLQGTRRGGLTDAQGNFTLSNVPPGQHTVVARLIGYGRSTQDVTVRAGETATVSFELSEQALQMEEIVVTGQAGQSRRKEVGNAISQINMSEVTEATASTESLLQGQAPGVVVSEVSGSAGSGSSIRLRGNTSVTQGNDPLIYVDGVRIRSEGYPKNVPPVGYSGRSANVAASPLNDIDPNSIERIEIIKGAAATTLYGTEAAAGVVQVFTKSGSGTDQPSWRVGIDQSIDHIQAFGPDPSLFSPEFRDEAEAESHFGMDPWLRDSHGQEYSLSVRGGLQGIGYYLSGRYGNDKAPMPEDQTVTGGLRGNFSFEPAEGLQVQWNNSYNKRDIDQTPSGNNAHGLTLQAYRGNRNYVGSNEKAVIDSVLFYDITQEISHLTSGLTLRWQPTTSMSHRFTVGYDRSETENRQVRPFAFILAPEGKMSNTRFTNQILTLDYAASYSMTLGEQFDNTISIGGQYVLDDQSSVTGYAENFPGPGEPTLSTGSLTLSFEERIREDNAGVFAQNRIGFGDRLFLTTGIRFDGNSSFGQGIELSALQAYPKVSTSYVISDEGFWNDGWGTLKLRGAWGMSGRAPGAFDKVKTWEPVKFGQEPGFLPLNRGNPQLEPEKTAEYELGFDGSFLSDRLTTEFTWYRAKTTDALFPVRQIPSEGGWEAQVQNVGELVNTGVELSVSGTVLRQETWEAEIGGSMSTNHSEVVDLGDAASFAVGDAAYIEEGQPVPVLKGEVVTNPDENAAPVYEEKTFGPNQPTLIVQPRLRVRGPGGVVLRARGEFQGGHYIEDGATENGIVRSVRWPTCIEQHAMIDQGQLSQLTAAERGRCIDVETGDDAFIRSADFFKMRNISLEVPMTNVLSKVYGGITSASITLAARNAVRWINSDFPVFDPEMSGNIGHLNRDREGDLQLARQLSEHVPPAATYSVSLDFSF